MFPLQCDTEIEKAKAAVEVARLTYALPAEQIALSEIHRQRRLRFEVVVLALVTLVLALAVAWRPEAAATIQLIALALSGAWVAHSVVVLVLGFRTSKPPAPPASADP